MRPDGRAPHELRKIEIIPHYLNHPEGSVLIEVGKTKLICTASIEEDVPPFLKKSQSGWLTAEYAMLPRATLTRTKRERSKIGGRTSEIQRLIGRALRSVIDLSGLPQKTIMVDCDVIQADGGTRTASITGGFVAVVLALKKLQKEARIISWPVKDTVAATSLGIVNGELCLDLEYIEDSNADVDANLVMTGSGKWVEVQATAEKKPFSKDQWEKMLELGQEGIQFLTHIQKQVLNM